MKRLCCFALVTWVSCVAVGQEKPNGKAVVEDPAFLVEALNHRASAIRLRAAQLLTDEKIDATPALVDAVQSSSDLLAARAAVVLIDRLDRLRRTVAPEKVAEGKAELKLTPAERDQMRRFLSVVRDPHSEPWRFYLAVNVLDKLDRELLREALPELAAAATSGEGMRQYAAVQAMYHLGPAAREAQEALWSLLLASCRFQGLLMTRSVLDDDEPAYTDEIGVYDILLGLEDSFVIRDLFVLETLRRVGASPARLTAALACVARHESPEVRLDVARQLGLLEAPARSLAADVLIGLLCEPESPLKDLLSDENEETRNEAISLFTRLGPAAAKTVPALSRLLSEKDNQLRRSAAIILGEIGSAAAPALPALERALRFERLREGDDYEAMREAIRKITGKK